MRHQQVCIVNATGSPVMVVIADQGLDSVIINVTIMSLQAFDSAKSSKFLKNTAIFLENGKTIIADLPDVYFHHIGNDLVAAKRLITVNDARAEIVIDHKLGLPKITLVFSPNALN